MSNGQAAITRVLNEAFMEAKMRNPAFSLRAFARRVQLPPSAVSEVLNGKRRVSRKVAQKVVVNLGLNPKESKAILDLFPEKSEKGVAAADAASSAEFLQLSMDHFRLIADWYHYAVLSLVETEDFQSDCAWISARLGVRLTDIEGAVERLIRLNLLRRLPSGKFRGTGHPIHSTDEIVSTALRKHHAQNLELARLSLERDSMEDRDFTSVTMAVDPRKLLEAKKMIRDFRDRLCAYLESGRKHEVYTLHFSLFPLTSIQRSSS